MNTNRFSLRIPIIFIWVGFVSAISFMEAWLKFTASGVTLTTGLAIGKVVFGALNKVELTLAFALTFLIIVDTPRNILREYAFILIVGILLTQTFYILPILSSRIDIYLSGKTPEPSSLHSVYALLEVIKVLTLLLFGFKELKNENTRHTYTR